MIVGAGIIGAAAAHALQARGARVIVLDSGGVTATASSFGWINASFHHDAAHFRLRRAGIDAWERLGKTLALPLDWQGTLCWEQTGAAFDAQRDALGAMGYEVREIDRAAFAALEPHVAEPPERALHFMREAAADSPAVAEALLAAACAAGARRLRGLSAGHLIEKEGRIRGVQTQAGALHADHVLIAAGTGSAALMAQVGVPLPMLRRPALVLRSRPLPRILHHILVTDFGELRQLPDGTLLMPAAVNHQGDTSEDITQNLEATAQEVLARVTALLRGVTPEWQEIALAFRPVPQDGLPVIGAVREGLHVACMHSGITLAALAGEMVGQEMMEGVSNTSAALLAAYRPGRFTF